MVCPYCGRAAEKRRGADARPDKLEVADRTVWVCEPCDAIAWCFEGSDEPNGAMANKELRLGRIQFYKIAIRAAAKVGVSRERSRPWIGTELGIVPEDYRLNDLTIEQVRSGFETMLAHLNAKKVTDNG